MFNTALVSCFLLPSALVSAYPDIARRIALAQEEKRSKKPLISS